MSYRAILFLDFDGVLNQHRPETGYIPPHPGLDAACVERMAKLVKRYELGVCISSSWRTEYNLRQIADFLHAAQGGVLVNRLVGTTILLPEGPQRRNAEVQATREAYRYLWPSQYIVIDDAGKHGFPADHFVRTDTKLGFQRGDFERAVALLELQRVEVTA